MKKVLHEPVKPFRYPKNIGMEAERQASFQFCGIDKKGDNIPHTEKADVDDMQVKSARATICTGTDIVQYLQDDKAKRFTYVTSTFEAMYIMDKDEYIDFVNTFATITVDSKKNNGNVKMRLKHETKKMIRWLEMRI